MSDYNITLFEACEILNRSKKTIGRYIRQGRLNPQKVKSQQGTLEYRFSKADLEAFKEKQARQETQDKPDETGQDGQTEQEQIKTENKDYKQETGQDTPDTTDETDRTEQKSYISENKGNEEQTRQDETGQDGEIVGLLQDTVSLLKDQLTVKDKQIENLSGKIDQLIERDRETNILIKGLQDKVLMLEKPKEPEEEEKENAEAERDESEPAEEETGQEETGQDKPDETGQDGKKRGLLSKIFGQY